MSNVREINSLPFKGRVGVGMGSTIEQGLKPIPILTFPLKGKEITKTAFGFFVSN